MIVVAYLYNTNGMASWCWEAAHALAESGQEVVLTCEPNVDLPETNTVTVVRFAVPQERPPGSKVVRELARLSSKSSGFVFHLHQHLQKMGMAPATYLLNQSNLLDPRVNVPQHVVAWAYPTSLAGYVGKVGKFSGRRLSLNTIRVLFDAFGWWRRDWQAYRKATSVLAVTERLKAVISEAGISASVVHPGTAVRTDTLGIDSHFPCRLVICAQDLEDPRKRIPFLVEGLNNIPADQYRLTMIGLLSDGFKQVLEEKLPSITFSGSRRRDEVQAILAENDVFLFGSCLDDWGYVLVEAMSQGLCIVAPNLSPFDEIVGDAGVLYSPFSPNDLHIKISSLLKGDLLLKREAAQARALDLFSRTAFSQSLMKAVDAD